MSEEMQGRVVAVGNERINELEAENTAIKAALTDLMGTIMQLSNSLGPTLDAINNHYKVIMPLVQKPEVVEGGTL